MSETSEKNPKPGTPAAIIEALCRFAEAECGHNRLSARHPLGTVRKWVAESKATVAALTAKLEAVSRERDDIMSRAIADSEYVQREFATPYEKVGMEGMISRLKSDLAAANQEVERMRPLAKFGEKIARTFDFMGDMFGGYIQDWGVECGVFNCEPYDSAKHGPSDEFEDGDDYYTFNAALLAPSEAKECGDGK